MPRDMTGMGRYPPQPKHQPFAFYTSIRNADPELLDKIMTVDPYFVTQDNGAGAPIHFATTYRHLDMVGPGLRTYAFMLHLTNIFDLFIFIALSYMWVFWVPDVDVGCGLACCIRNTELQ